MRAGAPAPTRPAGGPFIKQHVPKRLRPACPGATRLGRPVRRTDLGPRRMNPRAAASGKDGPATIASYTVQKGETLWDVAVQHGVSMRTVKDLNKLAGSEPVLTEGQQLLVPASGITALANLEGAASAAALGSTPARGMWVGSEHVRLATIGEAKQLYLRQCDRANSQNTLLVLYAPWCPHCREMEDELERLAEGLSHVSGVRVVAVNGDSLEGRIFSREVLGVAYYPSIISFPAHSRTFFKYKGRQRDAESLLRFLNMTCCAREDQMWSLRATGTHAALAASGGKTGALQWANQWTPVGTSPGAMAAAVGLLGAAAAAAALWAARSRRASSGGGGTVQADMVAELDSSLGRMALLMLRAVGTRLSLVVGLAGSSPEAGAAKAAEPQMASDDDAAAPTAAPAVAASAAAASEAPLAASPTTVLRGQNGNGLVVSVTPAPSPAPSTVVSPAALDSSRVRAGAAAAAPPAAAQWAAVTAQPAAGAAAAAAAADSTGLLGSPRGLTAEERMRLTRLTDDELIALVNSDPDLDKVLTRLLGDK